MALLNVVRIGDPVLRHIAAPVVNPSDPAIGALADSMAETMLAAPGVGLAAPQIGQGFRLIVMRIMADRGVASDETQPVPVMALINPEWQALGPETELGWEGCLSVPDLRGVVPRFTRIAYRGWLPDGTRIEAEASGFQARILQHEVDHLDGVTYLDRMTDLASLGYNDEIDAAARSAATGVSQERPSAAMRQATEQAAL